LSDGRKKEIYQDVRFFHGAIQLFVRSFTSMPPLSFTVQMCFLLPNSVSTEGMFSKRYGDSIINELPICDFHV